MATKTRSIRAPEELWADLDRAAAATGRKANTIAVEGIRALVDADLAPEPPAAEKSVEVPPAPAEGRGDTWPEWMKPRGKKS